MRKYTFWPSIVGLSLLIILAACSQQPEEPLATDVPATTVEAEASPAEESDADPTELPAPTVAPEVEPVATAEAEVTEEAMGICEEPIYLSIIWHQHQPVYFKDPETDVYVRPWVRVHAAKDYVDMAAMLEQYPDIRATFNLTPSLIRQLDDLAAGAKDLYWVYTEIPAEELTDEQKQFILDRFFDTNRKIIGRFSRYQELLDKRDSSADPLSVYTEQDFRDLQLLFNLAWTDPDWLAEEPLDDLVAKGEGYSEEDKAVVLDEHLRLIQEVVPLHRRMQDAGQIEVTMTPFAHPILPLLVSTNLATKAMEDVELPAEPFVFGQDAVAQVERGVALYEDHFGRAPTGMWPAEGSVAQEIVTMVAENGIQWMASDEGVLAKSLGLDSFTRNSSEVVTEAGTLYRPYYVEGSRGGPVAMVFRDVVISDRVGFTYSGMPGEAAAADFMGRIGAICDELAADGAEGPHLVSVILDGENAWEHYDNDGKEFLHTMYRMLSEDPTVITVTPGEFMALAPDQQTIQDLWAGSWISHDFSTWIGEEEENRGWDYLKQTRDYLQSYITGKRKGEATGEQLAAALDQMYIAEGSDWFWWYGSDQESSNDASFDAQYRNTLKQVYVALGAEPPAVLDVPIIPEQATSADRPSIDLISPTIDGVIEEAEWDAGGQYVATGGAMAAAAPFFADLTYGFDAHNLYLKMGSDAAFAFPAGDSALDVYLSVPGSGDTSNFSQGGSLLGFGANRLLELRFTNGDLVGGTVYQASGDGWEPLAGENAAGGQITLDFGEDVVAALAAGEGQIETALPLAVLGNADSGARITLRAMFQELIDGERVDVDQLPSGGPAAVVLPDLGTTVVIADIVDPEIDDYGPGSYAYPQDAVFKSGNFDITSFQVGFDEQNIVFRFTTRGPIDNVWDSPNGISLQTFDIYIDQDGDGQGGVAFLPGRNLALEDGSAWDYAITVEGWTPGIYTPGEEGPQQIAEASAFSVTADPDLRRVTIRVPKSILGDTPENWRYAAGVMSQEGFPSSGVMRVRDVVPTAEQWRIGGAPDGTTNHTRVLDLVWPEAGQQETWLADFTGTDLSQSSLTAADFARVPMFEAD